MGAFCAVVGLFFSVIIIAECQKRGVQMRLTSKGMDYAVQVGIDIMKKDFKKNVINESGRQGKTYWNIQNMRITDVDFGNYKLIPVAGDGMRGIVSGITLTASGRAGYEYRGWIKLRDSFNIRAKAKDVNFDVVLNIGKDGNGRPIISLRSCRAGIKGLDLRFSGGASWLYNLLSGIIEKKLKNVLGSMMCKLTNKEIKEKASKELSTFPVVKKLDRWAEIDYRLTSNPTFTSQYMDAYLQGEFKDRKTGARSTLPIPSFQASADASKHVYFWISDFTVNTAGQVYHKTGFLRGCVSAWEKNIPAPVKLLLNTRSFALFVPALYSKYPGADMMVCAESYKAPTVKIEPKNMQLHFFADIVFKVKDNNNKIVDVFTIKFDITADGQLGINGENITADIRDFDYSAKLVKSDIGTVNIPFNHPIIKGIIDNAIVKKANTVLNRGFPLPKIKDVELRDATFLLEKNVIRLGTDLHYSGI